MNIYRKIICFSLVIALVFSGSPLHAHWKKWVLPTVGILSLITSQVAAQSDCDCSSDTNFTDPNVINGYGLVFVAVGGCAWSAAAGAVVWMCTRCNDSCTGETGLERGAYCHNLACGCFRGYKDSDWERRVDMKSNEKLVHLIKMLLENGQFKAAQLLVEGEDPKVQRKLIKDRVFDQVAQEATSAEHGAKGKLKIFKDWLKNHVRSRGIVDEENQLESVQALASSGEDAEYEVSEDGDSPSRGSWGAAVSDEENDEDPAADVPLEKETKKDKRLRSLGKGKGKEDEGNQ